MTYRVVENAGHEGEFIWHHKFPTWEAAEGFRSDKYMTEELDRDSSACLHVMIAKERADGSLTYDY